MSKKFIPARKLYYMDEEKPPAEFRAFFRGPELYATPRLWQDYKNWKKSHTREDYALFAQEHTMNPASVQAELDSMPNPFANATKGKSYRISFFVPASIHRFKIEGLRELGLDWSHDRLTRECVVAGNPNASGQYSLILHGIWPTWRKGRPIVKRAFPFIINPDPAELWQNLPSDQQAEYARPDTEFASLECGGAKMWGASIRGRSHAHKGLPRDDAFALACVAEWLVMAVADGAGSAAFSRKGAELACQSVVETCREKLPLAQELTCLLADGAPEAAEAEWLKAVRKEAYNILPQAAFAASKAIRLEAQARERQTREYASTLLICLARRFAKGWALLSFQIGDGAMAAFTPDSADLLAIPDEGEFGGQTRFVTMPELFDPHELMRRLKVQLMPDLKGVVMMTDGVSDARFGSLEELQSPEQWKQLFNELVKTGYGQNPEKDILEWLNFWSRGNHDDRTITWLATAD